MPETVTVRLGQLPELSDVRVILAEFISISVMQEVAQCHTPKSHMWNDTGLDDIFSPTEETSKYLYKGKRRKRVQILYGILSILSEIKCDIYWNRCEDKLDPNTRFTDRENKMYREQVGSSLPCLCHWLLVLSGNSARTSFGIHNPYMLHYRLKKSSQDLQGNCFNSLAHSRRTLKDKPLLS